MYTYTDVYAYCIHVCARVASFYEYFVNWGLVVFHKCVIILLSFFSLSSLYIYTYINIF